MVILCDVTKLIQNISISVIAIACLEVDDRNSQKYALDYNNLSV